MVYFMVGMYTQKAVKAFLLILLSFLIGCEATNALLPLSGTYKVNAHANGLSLDECSFISSKDQILPYFENSVYNDPDVTALKVSIKEANGEFLDGVIIYSIDAADYSARKISPTKDQRNNNTAVVVTPAGDDDDVSGDNDSYEASDDDVLSETDTELFAETGFSAEAISLAEAMYSAETEFSAEAIALAEAMYSAEEASSAEAAHSSEDTDYSFFYADREIIIPVNNLDRDIPFFFLQNDMPIGRYTMVFHVLSENKILYKTEKSFFYLGDAKFNINDIHVHLPGIAADYQLIPKSTTIMLEARLDFDYRLKPYVVWYNGKKIISEGNYLDGAGNLLLKAPEQNSFFSIRAEIFPAMNRQGLTGYSKEISSPVSSKASRLHLLSKNTPELLQWYTFEGELYDLKDPAAEGKKIKPAKKKALRWLPYGGIYGLAAGTDDVYILSNTYFPKTGANSGYFLFRFKPLNNGKILTVQFGPSYDVTMNLEIAGEDLLLSLESPVSAASGKFKLPKTEDFITAGVNISILKEHLAAQLIINREFTEEDSSLEEDAEKKEKDETELVNNPVILKAQLNREFKIMFGDFEKEAAQVIPGEVPVAEVSDVKRKSALTAIWDEFAFLHTAPMKLEYEKKPKEDQLNPKDENGDIASL